MFIVFGNGSGLDELRMHKQRQDEWEGLVGKLFEDNDLVICTDTGAL